MLHIPARYRILGASLWTLIAAVLLCGCTTEKRSVLEQQQRESVAAGSASEFAGKVRSEPLPPMTFTTSKDGTSKLEIPQAQQSETTARSESFENFSSAASGSSLNLISLPTGTKLLLLAAGAAAIAAVVWLIRRSSKAANAAWTWADETLGDQINKVRDQMADATDPAKVAALRSIEASLLRKQAEALRP